MIPWEIGTLLALRYDFARVVQVGHKLRDTEAVGMVSALANRLTNWTYGVDGESKQAIFFSLGLHLQQEVLQHVGCHLHEVIFTWPLAMQHVCPIFRFTLPPHIHTHTHTPHRRSININEIILHPHRPATA